MISPTCLECGGIDAQLVKGDIIYPHRPDLAAKDFWRCPCGAYCGCHPGTVTALGFPCGPETRRARNAAHAAFDPLWERKITRDNCSKSVARRAGYQWLAEQMGMTRDECHISMMTAAQARRVVEICQAVRA